MVLREISGAPLPLRRRSAGWKARFRAGTALLALLLASSSLSGQQQPDTGTQVQQRVLEVRRRQVELRAGKAELQRNEQLFKDGLISPVELERARARMDQLQLNYQEALLSLLSLQPRIAVQAAVKFQDASGRQFIRLTVANLTPAFDDTQFRLLNNFEGADPIPEALRTRDIRDIFISLQDPGSTAVPRGTTVGLPYESHISQLRYGESKTLVFQLLRDVSQVLVAVNYLGQQREIQVQLEQAGTGNVLSITSTQISQEADLGTQVTYSLRLERSTVDVRGFQLRVLGLPKQISYSFIEPQTQARLSQLNFPAGVTQQSLDLRLFLPEQADSDLAIDRPVSFWAVALDAAHADALPADRAVTQEEIQHSGAGSLRLSLTPRGVGKIEVAAASLFSEIEAGQPVRTPMTVRNTGTRRLDHVWLRAEGPIGWKTEIQPAEISSLDLRRDQDVKLVIVPPESVAVGDYEVRIKTESLADNRRVSSEDKIYRVNVKPRSNLLATTLVVVLLGGMVVGVVFFSIRLTRR